MNKLSKELMVAQQVLSTAREDLENATPNSNHAKKYRKTIIKYEKICYKIQRQLRSLAGENTSSPTEVTGRTILSIPIRNGDVYRGEKVA